MAKVNSRAKGIRGELEAAKLWKEFYPDCERLFGQARYGGSEAPDIGSPLMNKYWYVEVKRYKSIRQPTIDNWKDKLRDDFHKYILTQPEQDRWAIISVLMYRGDRAEWRVIIDGRCMTWQQFKRKDGETWEHIERNL